MKNLFSLIVGVFSLFCVSTLATADILVRTNTTGVYLYNKGVTYNGVNRTVTVRNPPEDTANTKVRYHPDPSKTNFVYCTDYGSCTNFAVRIMTDINGVRTIQIKPWDNYVNGDSWYKPNSQDEYPTFILPAYGTATDAVMIWADSACEYTYHDIVPDNNYAWVEQSEVHTGQIGILAYPGWVNWIGHFTIKTGTRFELQFRSVALDPLFWRKYVSGK